MIYDYVLDKCDDGYFCYCSQLQTGTEIITGYSKQKKRVLDEIRNMINKLEWDVPADKIKDKTV